MTPLDLQDALVEELERIFSGHTYKAPTGERAALQVFPQLIPISDTDDEADPVPYVIVRLNNGEDEGTRDSAHTVSLVIIIGIWDDAGEAQGHRDVLNIIQKIYQRFHENPDLDRKAVCTGEFQWAVQEDNYYPYAFGACSMKFNIAAVRREDDLA